MSAVLRLVTPEFGDGDGDGDEGEYECPECGHAEFRVRFSLYATCARCGCEVDFNDDEEEYE